MKGYYKQLYIIVMVTIFLSPLYALEAKAIYLEGEIGDEGISIEYGENSSVKDTIEITPDQPFSYCLEILNLDIMCIEISINEIKQDPPVVDTNFYFKLVYPSYIEHEFDIPIAFGEFGIETDPYGLTFNPIDESNKIDISVTSGLFNYQYDIKLEGEIINGRWEGQATFFNNVIKEDPVVINTESLPDLPLPPDVTPPSEIRFENITSILVFTISPFNLSGVSFDIYFDDDLFTSIPDDIPILGAFLPALPIPLFKGSFRLWANFES